MTSKPSMTWDGYALSLQQERLLSDQTSAPRFACMQVKVTGNVQLPVLKSVLITLVENLEVLRTTYRPVLGKEGAVLMALLEPYSPDLVIQRAVTEDMIAADLKECTSLSCLDDDQPFKVRVYEHSANETTIVLLLPELSADRQSMNLLFQQMVQTYQSSEAITDNPVVQYIDFAQWQSSEVESGHDQPRIKPFKETSQQRVRLPLATAGHERALREERLTVTAEQHQQLQQWADRIGVSLDAALQACWLAAVYRCSALPDQLTVMVPHSGRAFEELISAIGLFEICLPLTLDLPEAHTLERLAQDCQRQQDRVYQAAQGLAGSVYAPGEKLPSDVGYSFYNVSTFESTQDTRWYLYNTSVAEELLKVHLQVQLSDVLDIRLLTQVDGIAPAGADALKKAFLAMISHSVSSDGLSIQQISLLNAEQFGDLFRSTHDLAPVREYHSWLSLFQQWVQDQPDRVAIQFGDRQWSYHELDLYTSRLATYFSQRGVEAEAIVGVRMERSDTALAVMVALHKCGAAYTPMDPHLPSHRQEAIIDQLQLNHLVVDDNDEMTTPDSITLHAPLNDAELIRELPVFSSSTTIDGQTPAYVLYTSGSTGHPKGVIVHHDALVNYALNITERAELKACLKYLSIGPLFTDLGYTTLFPALMNGGTIELAPYAKVEETQELIRYMETVEYDVLKITPSHLTSLFALTDRPETLMPSSALLLGGEILSWGMAKLMQSFAGQCRLFNHYGPTETCVGVVSGEIDFETYDGADFASTVPLGRPLPSARCYVVDPNGQPVPLGVEGELYLGGNTVALNYVEADEKLQARFVQDLWSAQLGGRMYRSGDRARFLPDGQIEFLGRIDRQVKVRGFRVEPGEIEASLCKHEQVMDARVVEHGDSGSKHLLAYVVMTDGRSQNEDWLKDFVAEYVPEFMVPKQVVSLSRFPITSAGKLDVHALPDPDAISNQIQVDFVQPTSDVECRLAELFKSLLLLNQVSLKDDFFEVGGHSLIATKLVAAIRKEFNIRFNLRSVFMDSTLDGLSKAIEAQMAQ